MDYMSDTIFYSGKKKRTVQTTEIYEKIKAGIKKKGPNKDWICELDPENESICISFQDGESETFILEFDGKGVFSGCCKLFLPLDETTKEEDRTLMTTLLDLLYKAKNKFNTIQITDDYGLAESYWENKKFKFDYRELSESGYLDRAIQAMKSCCGQLWRKIWRCPMKHSEHMSIQTLHGISKKE